MKGTEFKFPEQRGFGPGGPGGFGPGGPGGPMGGGERKLVKEFDKDGDGMLNNAERQVARKSLQNPGGGGRRGGPGFGPPGGFGGRENQEPAKPGPHVSPADVKAHPDAPLYEPNVLRTFFLEFENKDWETELSDFHGTDVEIPATLTVDGKKYPNVGIHFRGMSSYMMVSAGYKRSMNLSLDFVDSKQRLYGYKTLNLLNSHEDASFLSTVLYSEIARKHIPAPKANFVKLVINGESWGVYVNTQQFNKDFLAENYPSTKGTRWKVRGSPGGGGGLEYIGDNIEDYKRRYEMKTEDGDKVWREFIKLCRTLNETPADRLEESLKPMLDIDGVLWFLALDVALINNDGYWVRASDYSIYRDAKGVFHIIPHDMNEAFHGAMGFGFGGPGGPGGGFGPPGGGPGGFGRPGGGPRDQSAPRGEGAPRAEGQPRGQDGPRGPGGRGMGPGGGGGAGVELDPLVALDDPRKPLRSKLLAVPSLKARYLEHVRTIAEESLDWKKLQPVVEQYASLIEEELEADTRKLTSLDAFKQSVSDKTEPATEGRRRQTNLRTFVESRRNYLLSHPEIKKVVSTPTK
ncbi:MAG: CotH kinase family protein [Planctomycetales bacterium]|nr:CotH kinase family protein [Planctomycetales bacterium]